MLITLDIKNESMKDNFLNFIGTLDYIDIKYNDEEILSNNSNNSNNKFNQFAGMWQDRDINKNTLRKKSWKNNTDTIKDFKYIDNINLWV